MTPPFAVTWDYRCPYAYNAHTHVIAALEAGAPWQVTFTPFSLNQVHVEDGEIPVWEDPGQSPGLLAMQAALAVRDQQPERFLAVHRALFAARHVEARDLRDQSVVRTVIAEAGADAGAVFAEIDSGVPLDTFRREHEAAVSGARVFGVPTFVVADKAVFVRLLTRHEGDPAESQRTIESVIDLITGRPELNELKHTSIPR
jgi:2-hydroxychromene-2-carboxylate isomerase